VEEEIPSVDIQNFSEEPEINHGIAQGMLVTLGQIYGYETYAPPRDQTTRIFQNKPLSQFVTVSDCTSIFSSSRNLAKIREIDVLWFDEDDDGLFPTFAFEVEETTGVKSGLDRLLKIPQRYLVSFYIIAPTDKEKQLFNRYVNQTPFRSYKDRFSFQYYRDLEILYNSAVQHDKNQDQFGIHIRR
jgi:hypothetical protein